MIRTGIHAATIQRDGRGFHHVWNGPPPTVGAQAIFRDLSWHAPFASFGARFSATNGGNLTRGFKGYASVPFDCQIVGVLLTADRAGSAELDLYRSSFAAFPPRQSDTIAPLAAWRPRLNAQASNAELALYGWSTILRQGQVLGIDILSVSGISSLTLTLLVQPNHRL